MDSIQLDYPVTTNGQTFDSLTMRRPKVKDDLDAHAKGRTEGEREVILFAALCGVPRDVINELDQPTDYRKLQDVYEGFFVSTRPTSDSAERS